MVACAAVLTSCNNVLDEEGIAGCDDRTTVRLTISFGGDGGPMSRDVEKNPAPKDDDLDDTTEGQAAMNDIYALVVKEDGTIKELIDLTLLSGPDLTDRYYTRTFEGKFLNTNESIRIEVLANLEGNNINIDNYSSMREFISSYVDKNVTDLYNVLVYNYDGTTSPWSVTGTNKRGIPMWGKSGHVVPSTSSPLELTCYLYRALAKVQIWVNMQDGVKNENGALVIKEITFNNVQTQGFCVSQAKTFDTDGPNYDLDGNGTYDVYPYTAPSIPASSIKQSVTYSSLNIAKVYSDMIYLPENDNDVNEITMTFKYSFGEEDTEIDIPFDEDIIRNYSYIFNITKNVKGEMVVNYLVTDWEGKSINVPSFN